MDETGDALASYQCGVYESGSARSHAENERCGTFASLNRAMRVAREKFCTFKARGN